MASLEALVNFLDLHMHQWHSDGHRHVQQQVSRSGLGGPQALCHQPGARRTVLVSLNHCQPMKRMATYPRLVLAKTYLRLKSSMLRSLLLKRSEHRHACLSQAVARDITHGYLPSRVGVSRQSLCSQYKVSSISKISSSIK